MSACSAHDFVARRGFDAFGGLARAHQHDGGQHREAEQSERQRERGDVLAAERGDGACNGVEHAGRQARLGTSRRAERDAKLCDDEGGEESAPPRTRTQPLVRRPDRLRHCRPAPGMRDDVRHIVRELLDFTPNGNRAERVQTVNVGDGEGACMRRPTSVFQSRVGPLRHVLDIDAAERGGECALGFDQGRPHHLADQRRDRHRRIAGVLGAAGGAQDVFGGDALMLAREFVAAVRPADALAGCRRAPAPAEPVRDGAAEAYGARPTPSPTPAGHGRGSQHRSRRQWQGCPCETPAAWTAPVATNV